MEVPIIVYFFGLVTLLIAFLLNMTVFGKHVYAVGGNLTVAELSGIPVKKNSLWGLRDLQSAGCSYRVALVDENGGGRPGDWERTRT